MKKRGAPLGNDNAAKGKEFIAQLRKICVQEDWLRFSQAAQSLLTAAAMGEQWAIQMLAEKFDGKPTQSVESKVEHSGSITHEHSAVSETAAWLASVTGEQASGTPEKPVSH